MIRTARLLAREVLVDAPKRFVRERLQLTPEKEIDWYYIDAPESVMVVPFTDDGKVVLVRQYRRNLKDYALELPAGIVQENEAPEVAATRELFEETGYAADVNAMQALGRYYVLPSETNKYLRIYRASGIQKRGEPTRDKEIEQYFEMSVVEMTLADAIASIGNAINGIETTAALLMASRVT